MSTIIIYHTRAAIAAGDSVSGVYTITHVKSGKVYLGSSKNIRGRWRDHQSSLEKGSHRNRYLQRAWNKYGATAFAFAVKEECPAEQLQAIEQRYLDEAIALLGRVFVYNIALDTVAPRRGVKLTTMARARLCGRKPSAETRAKISAAGRGRVYSAETRAKMRERVCSAETRAKLSIANRGKKLSVETRARISLVQIGKKLSAEHRAKLSAVRRGKKKSDEHRAKLSLARKRWWANHPERARVKPLPRPRPVKLPPPPKPAPRWSYARAAAARAKMSLTAKCWHAAKRREVSGTVED